MQRVVQHGMFARLEVFRTEEGRGYGVRTRDELLTGDFVCEYIVMAYMVMAYVAMAYIGMAYIVMAYIVMACIVNVYIVMGGAGHTEVRSDGQGNFQKDRVRMRV